MLGDASALRLVLEPTIDRLGCELVYVTLVESKTRVLRVFIDAPGGITLDDCERVSRRVSDVLDVENVIEGEYNLEVSSPGINRPLVKHEHFEQVRGKEVFIQMQDLHLGRRKFKGPLIAVDEQAVVVSVDGEPYELLFSEMHSANLVDGERVAKDTRRRREDKNG
jgi:ribosome maturation factor RimP